MTFGIIVGTLSYAAVTGIIWLGVGGAIYRKLTDKGKAPRVDPNIPLGL